MTTLKTHYSRVTEAAKWPGGPAALTITCSRRGATGFEPEVEVVLEERPDYGAGRIGEWQRVRAFREDFDGHVPLAVGEFRVHFSQTDDFERTWTIDVRGDDRQAFDLTWHDAAAERFRRRSEQGLNP